MAGGHEKKLCPSVIQTNKGVIGMGVRKRTMTNQITNELTFESILKQMVSIAKVNYIIEGLPDTVWMPYVYNKVLYNGSIAFYIEPDIGLIALPYQTIGKLDIYNRPMKIKCIASNGQQSRILEPHEYVIMYDNTDFRSIIPDIRLYAQKMAQTERTADINIIQQRTPRIIKGSQNQEQTIKRLYADIDRNEEVLYLYKDLDLDDIDIVLQPAPFVADKLDEHSDRIWNNFCRLVGVSNLAIQKKERLISSEVNALQGGAIASRWSRYLPRAEAVKQINTKFSDYIEGEVTVRYYDDLPESENIEEYSVFGKGENINDMD